MLFGWKNAESGMQGKIENRSGQTREENMQKAEEILFRSL